MTISGASPDKTLGQRELVVMLALLMSLQALAIDGMLPALDNIASELGAGDGNRRQLVVATYLLAPGFFADRIAASSLAAGAVAVSGALGAAPEVAELVLRRYTQTLSRPAAVPAPSPAAARA